MSTTTMQTQFTTYDRRFADVLGDDSTLTKLLDTEAHEGPVYVAAEDALYFTTVPRDGRVDVSRLLVRDRRVEIIYENANRANGMTLDLDGSLLICEQGDETAPARVARLDLATRDVTAVVDEWRGLRLNSPNDVVAKSDGTIWFTDPSYGRHQGFRPEPQVGDYVYRFDPATGRADPVTSAFDKPNGLAFCPNECILYVGDSGANHEPGSYDPARPHHILAFDVSPNGRLLNERLFAVVAPGFPDGLKVDLAGRVYTSCASGVVVYAPNGDLLGQIELPGAVNFTFGGPGRNTLFITTDDAVWAARLAAKGA